MTQNSRLQSEGGLESPGNSLLGAEKSGRWKAMDTLHSWEKGYT